MWTARRQLGVGVLLGLMAAAIWFGFHYTFVSLGLLVVSTGFITHAPCIRPSGEHGETCAGTGGELRSERAREGLITPDAIASALIITLIVVAGTPALEAIRTRFPSVAETVTSHWFKEAAMWAGGCVVAFLWIVRVLTAARTLKES